MRGGRRYEKGGMEGVNGEKKGVRKEGWREEEAVEGVWEEKGGMEDGERKRVIDVLPWFSLTDAVLWDLDGGLCYLFYFCLYTCVYIFLFTLYIH